MNLIIMLYKFSQKTTHFTKHWYMMLSIGLINICSFYFKHLLTSVVSKYPLCVCVRAQTRERESKFSDLLTLLCAPLMVQIASSYGCHQNINNFLSACEESYKKDWLTRDPWAHCLWLRGVKENWYVATLYLGHTYIFGKYRKVWFLCMCFHLYFSGRTSRTKWEGPQSDMMFWS